MSRGGCSRPESSWNRLPIPRWQRFQLDSAVATSQPGHCYRGMDMYLEILMERVYVISASAAIPTRNGKKGQQSR
eukprot:gene26270-biopygen15411